MEKTYTKTTITEAPRLVIRRDDSPESPREWSKLGYFITVDRNYQSPDDNNDIKKIITDTGDQAINQAEHIKLITEAINETGEKVLAIYPVVKYEHSGVSYSRGSAHGFDYSNNGFYIITDKTQKETGTEKKDWEKVIDGEIEIYNKYCNGEVYGFTLYNEAGELEDSCCGFYDLEDIRGNLPAEWQGEDLTEYIAD